MDAGASAVQLFDSWAGVLSAADYEAGVLPYSREVFEAIGARDVPRIHFGVGTGELLPLIGDGGRGRRRRRLAGAAGRGRPPGRPGPLAAGQPRPRRAARRPRDRRPRGAPGRRAGPGGAGAHLQPRPRRAARHRPRRAHPRRRPGPRAHRPDDRRLVVVGAGITGLAAAFEWRRRRPDDEIVVLEAGDRIGGKLHRVELAGHWYDTGPEAVLARVPEAVRLVEDLGLGDRLVAPATTQASVVLPDGRHPLPAGTVLGVPASADGLDGFLSAGRRRAGARRGLAAAAATRRRRRGRRHCCASDSATRWSTGWSSRCWAASTPAGPTSSPWPRRCRRWPRSSRRPGSVLAAAAASRDAGIRSRGDADGPVFATVPTASGRCPTRWSPPSGADVRLRTPAHGLRRTASGLRALDRPGRGAGTADRRRRDRHRARARRPPGCWPRRCPARSSRCRASRTRRWPWSRWPSRPRTSPPARGCSCRR